LFSRPSLAEVLDYREHVDRHMVKLIETAHDDLKSGDLAKLIVLGLNHEQQHQELIVTDIKHGLWSNPLRPAWKQDSPSPESSLPLLAWKEFDENLYAIGFDGEGFSFDNETPRHQVFLNRFRLASRLVTNGEYLEFIRGGGYSRPEFWLSDGWDTVNAQRWNAPLYWEERDGEWQVFTVNGMQPVVMSEPVCHVSYYEADAFAHWAGARLPLESEWEVASSLATSSINGNFLESGRLHPRSAGETDDRQIPGSPDTPISQLFGDVWEWTASAYSAYPGFAPAAGVLGEYNGKFMSGQMVLRGGSCATPQSHIRASYRNFFPPHARWQFMGIRLGQ
jgi:ergothioneine biosynthesis protein EgtB